MFERFTEKSIQVIMMAQDEARRMNHNFLGSEQLLLGIIAQKNNEAARLLSKEGLTLPKARKLIKIGSGVNFPSIDIPFTPRAKSILSNACDIATNLSSMSVAPEHIFLGILKNENSAACRVLLTQDINLSELKANIYSSFTKRIEIIPKKTVAPVVKRAERVVEKTNNSDFEKRLKNLEELMNAKNPQKTSENKEHCVFIGHGRSQLWANVNTFLRDDRGLETEYFEKGSRAGKTVISELQACLDKATFAVIIMTAEDEQQDGGIRARQNVIHEIGLFQGKLGFEKVAILHQKGVEEFSNIDGLQYIPFSENEIDQTFYKLGKMLDRENIKGKVQV